MLADKVWWATKKKDTQYQHFVFVANMNTCRIHTYIFSEFMKAHNKSFHVSPVSLTDE